MGDDAGTAFTVIYIPVDDRLALKAQQKIARTQQKEMTERNI
jgi:hypothetical protein